MAEGKIIAVWGSPHSGKTTLATTLATAVYDSFNTTVILVYADLDTPMLPVIFPNEKNENLGSVGAILSKTEIDRETLLQSLVIHRDRQNLAFLGYREGENKYTYPKYGKAKAEELFKQLTEIADYVIVDCPSTLDGSPLSLAAIESAQQIIRLASPELCSISWYLSQAALYEGSSLRWQDHIQGINTPNADVFMPVEETKAHLGEVSFTVPYCRQVKEQMQKGKLYEPVADKAFAKRLREIAGKVVAYGQE